MSDISKEVRKIEHDLCFVFPRDYLDFVPVEKEIEFESDSFFAYFFPVFELGNVNLEYEVDRYLTNHVLIGSNGGGIGIFYHRKDKYLAGIPLIGMDDIDEVIIARSFTEFLQLIQSNASIEI